MSVENEKTHAAINASSQLEATEGMTTVKPPAFALTTNGETPASRLGMDGVEGSIEGEALEILAMDFMEEQAEPMGDTAGDGDTGQGVSQLKKDDKKGDRKGGKSPQQERGRMIKIPIPRDMARSEFLKYALRHVFGKNPPEGKWGNLKDIPEIFYKKWGSVDLFFDESFFKKAGATQTNSPTAGGSGKKPTASQNGNGTSGPSTAEKTNLNANNGGETSPGKEVNQVGIVNWWRTPVLRLRSSPDTNSDKNIIGALPFNTTVTVIKAVVGDWYYISTKDGKMGYVAAAHIWTNLPEPNAKLHKVESGVKGTAIAIAEEYFKKYANDWGQDLRFYVNVLALVNKKSIPNTTDGWREVHFDAGDLIWIPSQPFARSMQGAVNSGSLSYNVLDAVGLAKFIEGIAQKIEDFKEAIRLSKKYIPDAIKRHAEEALINVLISLAMMLLVAVAILAVTTAIGAALGALLGGVGAAPGAAAGFEVGMTILNWLGMAMLVKWIADTLIDVGGAFGTFLKTVWNANGDSKKIDQGAKEFAEAVGLLIGKVIEAVVLYAAGSGLSKGLTMFKSTKLGKLMGETKAAQWLTERFNNLKGGNKPSETDPSSGKTPSKELTPKKEFKPTKEELEVLEASAKEPVEIKAEDGKNLGSFSKGNAMEIKSKGTKLHGSNRIELDPNATTTVTGTLRDVEAVAMRGGRLPGSTMMGENKGGINILRSPKWLEIQAKFEYLKGKDENLYWRKVTEEFWETANKPWLLEAIARGDKFRFVSNPKDPLAVYVTNKKGTDFIFDGKGNKIRSIFGREVDLIIEHGFEILPDGTAVKK